MPPALSTEFINHLKNKTREENLSIENKDVLSGHSNTVIRLKLKNGRRIMIKKSQFEWAAPRFQSARQASFLLQDQKDFKVPEHIPISKKATDNPTLAYWYLPYPTLKDLWPNLSFNQRKEATKKLGSMLRRLHNINVDKYGLLHSANTCISFYSYMKKELLERLKPTIGAKWSEALWIVNRLVDMLDKLPERNGKATLVHNDLHLDNILCQVNDGEVECIGLLDLEETIGGVWELDIASAITMHHPLFAEENGKGDWLDDFGKFLQEGYGKKPDPKFLRFFRLYHLVNLGMFSAMSGDDWHAERVKETTVDLLKAA